jgi:hypothetical protein
MGASVHMDVGTECPSYEYFFYLLYIMARNVPLLSIDFSLM